MTHTLPLSLSVGLLWVRDRTDADTVRQPYGAQHRPTRILCVSKTSVTKSLRPSKYFVSFDRDGGKNVCTSSEVSDIAVRVQQNVECTDFFLAKLSNTKYQYYVSPVQCSLHSVLDSSKNSKITY